ncbi:MAG: cupin domain-containing protein [Candidatus Eisenbacteria bacterium]
MPTREELGRRLKDIRLQKGLTLKEVEVLSGVSMTHTSQIERGMTSPTIGALEKLAKALDKTASYFIEERMMEDIACVGKDERSILVNERTGIRLEGLSNGIPGGTLHFCRILATPITVEPHLRAHEGEEAITVLKGSLDLIVGGERFRLKAGDSAHFKAHEPHSFFCSSRSGAEAVWVGTSPPVL